MPRYLEPRSVVREYMDSGKRPKTASVASHVQKHFMTATQKEKASKQRPTWRCFATGGDTKDENVIASTSPEREALKRTSCYMLQASKQYHMYERGTEAKEAMQNAPLDPREVASLKRREHFAAKHEATMQRRRVNEPYMYKVEAQTGTHLLHPNDSYADELGRNNKHVNGWMINNNRRQELEHHSGEPIMNHIMKGDYYNQPGVRKEKVSFIAMNKQCVRSASAATRQAKIHDARSAVNAEERRKSRMDSILSTGYGATIQAERTRASSAATRSRKSSAVASGELASTPIAQSPIRAAAGEFMSSSSRPVTADSRRPDRVARNMNAFRPKLEIAAIKGY